MEQRESKEEIFSRAKHHRAIFEKRLQILLNKPYLSEEDEVEVKNIKKQKLYYKDLMEKAQEETRKGESR
jgi:hypothetical protein